MHTLLILILTVCLQTAQIPSLRKFPEINYQTIDGKTFTNANLTGKNTIVLMFHLGCPPAMGMLKDLETLHYAENDSLLIIAIIGNTPDQVKNFNSTYKNVWSDLRNSFQLQPLQIPMIGECNPRETSAKAQVENMVGVYCEKLAKKIRTNSSPTIVHVNKNGMITGVDKGYVSPEISLDQRIAYLLGNI